VTAVIVTTLGATAIGAVVIEDEALTACGGVTISILKALLAVGNLADSFDAFAACMGGCAGLVTASAVVHGDIGVDAFSAALKTWLTVVAFLLAHVQADLTLGPTVLGA